MKKITIMGAGAFGFAMAKVMTENHTDKELFLFDINKEFIKHIHETRKHPIFHEGVELPDFIEVTTDEKKAVEDADLMILAIPSKFMRSAIRSFKPYLTKDVIFLNLSKGLEAKTNERFSEIINAELADVSVKYKASSLCGGMIAREVTLHNPLCADLACADRQTAKEVAKLLWTDYLHIETTDDIIGVELAGAFKNVIAIGAGVFDGRGYSASSKAAFVSTAAEQMRRLALAMGAKAETFGPGSQAWLGDLMTTCFGASRNREFGENVGKGMAVSDAMDKMVKANKSVEGYITTEVVHNLLEKHGVTAPALAGMYELLYNGKTPSGFVSDFIKGL